MIQCQNCGTFVPAEKAFCPNCSEPMEVEEKSNRSHSFSSDMMSTIRDDPEKYRDFLKQVKNQAKPQAQAPQPQPPAPAPPAPPAQFSAPPSPPPVANAARPAAPPAAQYNQWQPAPPAAAPQSNSKRNLILGISAVVLVAVVVTLLFVFKVI